MIIPKFGTKTDHSGLGHKDNLSGVHQEILIAPKNWFDTIAKPVIFPNDPTFTGTFAQMQDTVTIADDHIFKVGEGFLPLYLTFDTGAYSAEANTVYDKTGKKVSLKGFYAGNDIKTMALLENAESYEWIVLFKFLNDLHTGGAYTQLGMEGLFAKIFATFATGTTTGDRLGYSIDIQAYIPRMYRYTGTPTLAP